MIISRTPTRISFLGGGTDYPDYYRQHGGGTLATSIDKYVTITVHEATRFSAERFKICYSKLESVDSIDEIQHPSARECLRFLEIKEGVEIHYVSDLPARTGIGSSSAATVGLLHALHAFKGEMVSKEQLAQEAIYVEQVLIQERVGSQDQFACAIGGFNHFGFREDGLVTKEPVILTEDRMRHLKDRLMLFYTGTQRTAHFVVKEQHEATKAGRLVEELDQMKNLLTVGVDILRTNERLTAFGEVLHEGWQLKKKFSKSISNPAIDEAYNNAIKAGAVGGKLLGAGGGGFLLLYVEQEAQANVRQALSNLRETPFHFDVFGSRIVWMD